MLKMNMSLVKSQESVYSELVNSNSALLEAQV